MGQNRGKRSKCQKIPLPNIYIRVTAVFLWFLKESSKLLTTIFLPSVPSISIIMSSNIFFTKIFAQGNHFFSLLVWSALVAPCCDPYQRKTIIFQNRNNFMVRMIFGIFGHPNSSSAQKIAWCQNSTFAQMHFKKLKEELQATHSHSDRLAFSGKKIWHLMAANEGPFVLFLLA